MRMRLSIATKISLAFSAVILVFTLVFMATIWRTQRLHDQTQAINRHIVPLSLLLSDAQNDLKSFSAALSERDMGDLASVLTIARVVSLAPQRASSKLQRARDLSERDNPARALSERERLRLDEFSARLADITREAVELEVRSQRLYRTLQRRRDAQEQASWRSAIERQQAELASRTSALDLALSRLRNDLRIATDLTLASASDYERASLYALGISSAVALAVALGTLVIALLMLRPLRALTEGAKRIAQGEYEPVQTGARSWLGRDELATLTEEFDAMARALRERDRALQAQHSELLRVERLATIGRMTSLITHELRNPLSSIGLNAEMLLDELPSHLQGAEREALAMHLETITDEVDRLRDITEEYLVYARLPEPRFARHDIIEIVEQLIDFHAWEWSQQGITVEFETPDESREPLWLEADANQLRQALLNLIKNAVEASTEREGAERVVVRVEEASQDDTQHVTVAVRDYGEGIDPEIRDRVFEPFFSSKVKGTGLGLAMTQQIIAEHGGALTLESPEGGGALFCLTLPRQIHRGAGR